ncbi:MAG: hypothetical protein M0040_03620 [Actinomycetota bacterium]|nr:hypothetical protein [Actinomycetota bacterium]
MTAVRPSETTTPTSETPAGGPGDLDAPEAELGTARGAGSDWDAGSDLASLAASPAVRRWLERDGNKVGGNKVGGNKEGGAAHEGELRLLARFCASLDTTPDELVAQCLRATKSGDTAISTAGRRRTDEAISAFAAAEGAEGREAIVLGNTLRGFLIHNGIFMQGSAAID